jgi:hypothetical protein
MAAKYIFHPWTDIADWDDIKWFRITTIYILISERSQIQTSVRRPVIAVLRIFLSLQLNTGIVNKV